MNSKTILYVEDNSDDVDLTLRAFEATNFTHPVTVVWDGVEALDYLYGIGKYAERDKTDLPRLILLDLNLPKLNGLEFLKMLRLDPALNAISVIILTSSGHEDDRVQAQNLGADLYLQKPVDFDKFPDVIREIENFLNKR